jgi:predicted Abi (CAAX) family protease
MAGLLQTIARRAWGALKRRPRLRDLGELALAAVAFGATAAILGADLLRWSPTPAPHLGLLALRAFFIPALGEELVFRGALVPGRGEAAHPAPWIAASVVLFTAWHVVETSFLPGSAATFLRAALARGRGLAGLVRRPCFRRAVLTRRFRQRPPWTRPGKAL